MQQLSKKSDPRPCLICSKEGIRQPVEVLPNGGMLYMVAHESGQICKWAEYTSIHNLARPEKSKSPTYIKCPKCGSSGRLNWAHDLSARKEEQPFTFSYIIVHEKTKGTWGSGKTKMDKRRRCQSFTQDQRVAILKQIGRYIADPPKRIKKTITKNQKRPMTKNNIANYPNTSKAPVLKSSQIKEESERNGLDKYIERQLEIDPTVITAQKENKTKASKSNPNRNMRCCICNKIGTLRPRLRNGKLVYYFAHPKINGKEVRHHISLLNNDHMSYCKKLDNKQKYPMM